MSTLRQTAASATDLACRVTGRRQVVRAARFVLRRACLDVPNDLHTNGEASLQDWVLRSVPSGQRIHVIDVGANVGRWSAAMLAAAARAGRSGDLDLHVFEPSSYTFHRLDAALRGRQATLHQMAVSDRTGWSRLNIVGPGAGTNSLHQPTDGLSIQSTEEVGVTTLDSYAAASGLEDLTLVKIDTEGHDLSVLRGARELFAGQRISVAQFEYNHRWIAARCYLRDAFALLSPLGYQIGKLTPMGVEFYPTWDPELETFVEGNYVVCRESVARRLPAVQWWKAGNPTSAS